MNKKIMKLNMHNGAINTQAIPLDEFGFILKGNGFFTPECVDAIKFRCRLHPEKRECLIHVTLGPYKEGDAKDPQRRWHWDGNMENPTITPSVNCNTGPRCGWHGFITKGDWK